MTVISDYAFESTPVRSIVHVLDASRMLLRMGLRFAALSSILVAVFVWFAPGASWESDLMLYKLALSVAATFVAIACWQAAAPPLPPTVEVDVPRGELRLVREGAPAAQRLVKRCAFVDLQVVELKGRNIAFWEKGGHLLAEITLSNATAHAVLLHALRAAGKLD